MTDPVTMALVGGVLTSVALNSACTLADRSSDMWAFFQSFVRTRIYVPFKNDTYANALLSFILDNPSYHDDDKRYYVLIDNKSMGIKRNRVNEEQSRIIFNRSTVKIYPMFTPGKEIMGFHFWVVKSDFDAFCAHIADLDKKTDAG